MNYNFQGVLEGRHPRVHLQQLPGQGALHQVFQRGDGHQPQRHRQHAPGSGDDQVLEGPARDPEAGGPDRRVHAQGQGQARQVGQARHQDGHQPGQFTSQLSSL